MPTTHRRLNAAPGLLLVLLAAGCARCLPVHDPQAAGGARAASAGISVLAYVVDLSVDATTTFTTKSVITIEATQATDVVVVNAKQLTVDLKVTVVDLSGVTVRIPVNNVVIHEDRDEVEVQLSKTLEVAKKYEVTVTATGQLGKPSDHGLVRSTFDNQKSYLIAIRGSPTSARTVFPCVDSPAQVADVTLHVTRPVTHVAISNGQVNETEAIGVDLARDTFAAAQLAPHQVGLVVAPLQRGGTQDAVVALWGRAEATATLADVQKYVSDLSGLVENLSGLPLALAHLSVVAVPGVAGAAAAAGLIALSEDAVVSLHEASPSSAHRDALLGLAEAVGQPAVRAATRPQRWADQWAPAGVAAHLRHGYADQAAQGWRFAEQQMSLQLQAVLEADAAASAAALAPADGTSDDATGLSQAAVDKGAVLVRMMEYALNATVYADAVRRYYTLGSKQALSVDDLYDTFTDAAYAGDPSGLSDGVTVYNVLSSWTSKPGYPVLTVVRDYETNGIVVTQKKFSWSPSAAEAVEAAEAAGAEAEWWLPLAYTYAEEGTQDATPSPVPKDWLVPGENDMDIEIAHLSSADWLYFNIDQAAPYRVNYDVTNWKLLTSELLSVQFDKRLTAASRAHLLGDALALARAGELDYALALDLAVYLYQEGDLLPWQVARRSLAFLEARLEGEGLSLLRQLEGLLLQAVYLDGQFGLGGQGDGHERLLRELAAEWACEAGLHQCVEHAHERYHQWLNTSVPPPADLLEPVLCGAVAKHGDAPLTFVLEGLTADTLVGGQRRGYVRAAACGPSEDVVLRAVEAAVNESGPFLASEVEVLLRAAGSRKPTGWGVVTDYIENSFQKIVDRTGNAAGLDSLLLHLASQVSSKSQLDKLLRAVSSVKGSDSSALGVAIQNEVAVNLAWSDKYGDLVTDWIRVYLRTGPPTVPTTTGSSTAATSPISPTTPAPTTAPSKDGSAARHPGVVTVALLAVAALLPFTSVSYP